MAWVNFKLLSLKEAPVTSCQFCLAPFKAGNQVVKVTILNTDDTEEIAYSCMKCQKEQGMEEEDLK